MYLVKTPAFIQNSFPNYIWSVPSKEKNLYLTFDDGPIAEVTPWVMEQLKDYDAKGTFFCVGENAKKNEAILNQIIAEGHAIGNHTFNHLNGWSTKSATYIDNVRKCAAVVHSKLFRPPYGRVRPNQAKTLRKQYRIVMWDILSGDFDPNLSNAQCLNNVIKNVVPGSIVVFHDSLKAEKKLRYVLPKVLDHFSKLGYQFKSLASQSKK